MKSRIGNPNGIRLTEYRYLVILITLVFLPLAIDLGGREPFIPVKQGLLMLAATLGGIILIGEGNLYQNSPLRNSLLAADTRLVRVVAVFWAWMVLAPTLTAINPMLHWVNVLQFSAEVSFFVLILAAIKNPSPGYPARRNGIVAALGFSGCLVAFHALLQAMNLDPIEFLAPGAFQVVGRWRLFSTMGNPNWTAEYLAITAPLAIIVLHRNISQFLGSTASGPWRTSLMWAGVTVAWAGFAVVVLLTGSRLGFIAFLAGSITTALYLNRRKAILHVVLITAFTIVLGVSGLLGNLTTRWLEIPPITGRLITFGGTAHLISRAPFAGHGLGHFILVLPDGLEAVVPALTSEPEPWLPRDLVAHAHNDWLELGVEGGLVAIFLLALLWLYAWQGLRPKIPSGEEAKLVAALRGALVALAILTMGSFPLQRPSTALLFWVILALIASRPRQARASKRVNPYVGKQKPLISHPAGAAILVVVTMLGLFSCAYYALGLLNANRQAYQGDLKVRQGNYGEAEEYYRKALEKAPHDHESWIELATLLASRGLYNEAVESLAKAEGLAASREAWLLRSELVYRLGYPDQAITVLERAVRIIPDFLRAQLALGDLYWHSGDDHGAAKAYQRIVASQQQSTRAEQIKLTAQDRLARLLQP